MFDFFGEVIDVLGGQYNQVLIVTVFCSFSAALIIIRMISHLHVAGVLGLFHRESVREIKNRGEVSKIKNRMLRKVAADYIRVAERAVTNVPTRQIVDRAVSNMSLLGWRYDNLLPFLEAFEAAAIWIGLILALVFPELAHVYGPIAIGSFVLLRLSASFFSVRSIREQLADEMVIYMEREIGRFFAADSGGAVLRLKNDLTDAIDRQAKAYKSAMEGISASMLSTMKEISASMIAASNSIGAIIQSGMDENLKNLNKDLDSAFARWEKALDKGIATHEQINVSAERISLAGQKLQVASELLATHMQGHSGALSNHLVELVDSIESLKDGYTHLALHQNVLTKQSEYIEKNQESFEKIAASYEAALQKLTGTIGDSIGTYVSVHTAESIKAINATTESSIEKLSALSS